MAKDMARRYLRQMGHVSIVAASTDLEKLLSTDTAKTIFGTPRLRELVQEGRCLARPFTASPTKRRRIFETADERVPSYDHR